MKLKLLAGLAIALPLLTVGCGKKEAPAQNQAAGTETAAVSTSTNTTPEQQAAIDSLQQPNPDAIKVDETAASDAHMTEHADHDAASAAAVAAKPAQ